MKSFFYVLIIASFLASCNSKPSTKSGVMVTTAWTAAYAMAAGVTDITVLASYDMVHPSEYELRPGDIARLANARLIIYAGYEGMVNQIKTGLEIPEDNLVLITTSYNFAEIEKAVILIAQKYGTEPVARVNLQEIKHLFENSRSVIQESGLYKEPALVHYFQKSFAEEIGIKPIGVFGPAPPEPKQILALTNSNASLVIDNAHNPVGGPLRETIKNVEYKMLLNFPGLYGTRTIADVIKYNTEQLVKR